MNISAVGASYTTAAWKPENAKQNSQTDPTTQQAIEGSDSFTKSAAADAALVKMKEGQAQGDNTGNGQQTPTQAPPDGPPPAKAAANKASSEDQTNQQLLSAARKISKSSDTDETSTEQTIVSDASSSSSEYTAAEIAEYDTNGDGKISSVEEAKMKADQAQKTASKNSSGSNLNIQMQSREAYQTAKWQMQAPSADSYQFSYQV